MYARPGRLNDGVIERFFEAVSCEHPCRREISGCADLAEQVDAFGSVDSTIRPCQAVVLVRPFDRYRQVPTTQPRDPESVADS